MLCCVGNGFINTPQCYVGNNNLQAAIELDFDGAIFSSQHHYGVGAILRDDKSGLVMVMSRKELDLYGVEVLMKFKNLHVNFPSF